MNIEIRGPLQVQLHHTVRLIPPEASGKVIVTAVFDNRFKAQSEGTHMAYTLPDDKQVEVQISYVDAHGHPASIDGDVKWETSDQSIVMVGVDTADSTKAMISPAGENIGNAQITATADADLGEGVTTLVTTFDVTVVGGEAVAGVIAPTGEPTPKPEPK